MPVSIPPSVIDRWWIRQHLGPPLGEIIKTHPCSEVNESIGCRHATPGQARSGRLTPARHLLFGRPPFESFWHGVWIPHVAKARARRTRCLVSSKGHDRPSELRGDRPLEPEFLNRLVSLPHREDLASQSQRSSWTGALVRGRVLSYVRHRSILASPTVQGTYVPQLGVNPRRMVACSKPSPNITSLA